MSYSVLHRQDVHAGLAASLPAVSRVLLVDLSNNNAGPIDWHRLKRSGVFGVWLKVSEGQSFTDETFRPRAAAARRAGLHVGGYHFARPEPGTAAAQAIHFAHALGPVERRDLRPFLDLEVHPSGMDGGAMFRWSRDFLEHGHSLTGVRLLTYSSPGFLAGLHWPTTLGVGAGLLVADYGPDDGRDHGTQAPHPWRSYVAHQYTSRGELSGIAGRVDLWHAPSRRRLLARGLLGLV